MNIYFIDNNDQIFNLIFNDLFLKGFKVYYYIYHKINEFYNFLENQNKNEDCFIIFSYNNNLDILNNLSENIKNRFSCDIKNLLIISEKLSKDDLTNILKFNPKKIFLINSPERIKNNIINYFINLNQFKNEKRFSERYDVSEHEIEVSFKNELNLKNYHGKIINISLKGVKIKFYKELDYFDKLINRENEIKIFFKDDPFVCKGKLIYYKNKESGIKFTDIKSEEFPKLVNFLKFFIFYA